MGFKHININQQAEVHHGGSNALWVGEEKTNTNRRDHWNAVYLNSKTKSCTVMTKMSEKGYAPNVKNC